MGVVGFDDPDAILIDGIVVRETWRLENVLVVFDVGEIESYW